MEASAYTKIFLLFLFGKSLIESVLDKRNMDCILKHRSNVPDRFRQQISLEEHQKAADYSIEKIKAGQIFHLLNLVVLLSLTLLGGLSLLNHYAIRYSSSTLLAGLLFWGFLAIFFILISLPKSLYFNFVIEEKYGFNKITGKMFTIDLFKSLFIGIILGTPVLYFILWIMENSGENFWAYLFLFLTLTQFLLAFIYPLLIAPLFNKFTPLEEGPIKNVTLRLLSQTGFKSKGIFVMDASKRSGHANAYFTGFGKSKRIVFFDTLLKNLEPEEVEAVLAHELGHMKKKHLLKGIIKGVLFSFFGFVIFSALAKNIPFHNGHGVHTISRYMTLTLFLIIADTYTFFLTPFSSFFSRKYEYEADQFASENSRAEKLISALIKMYKDNASTLTPDPVYSKFYFSHPPALERILYLEKLKR